MQFRIPPIYPITDKRLSGKNTHLAIVRELIRGGAALIQIRDKGTPVRELLLDIRRCVEYAAGFDVQIIVNDRCDLALLGGAGGVHLGQDDLFPACAREVMGRRAIVGFSTHSPAQARQANRLPVDYVAFGPIFATATKPDSSPATGLAALRRICRQSTRPVVAIGGIGLGQVHEIREAGAASIAVISAIMQARSIARSLEQFLRAAEVIV